jgi:hypothetical protein
MIKQTNLGGTFSLQGASITVNRMGYGAMQLAGSARQQRNCRPVSPAHDPARCDFLGRCVL